MNFITIISTIIGTIGIIVGISQLKRKFEKEYTFDPDRITKRLTQSKVRLDAGFKIEPHLYRGGTRYIPQLKVERCNRNERSDDREYVEQGYKYKVTHIYFNDKTKMIEQWYIK